MGKLNMNLLKGVEEQESAIDNSKAYQKEEPGKLKGAKKELQGTPQAPQKLHTAPEPPKADALPQTAEKAPETVNAKPQKAVMGFRAVTEKMDTWKLYADVTGREIGALCTAALDEYISRHGLTADQQRLFEMKKEMLNTERKIKSGM